MNANAIGIIGSIVDAHIAECTEPKPCDACAADREALARLARLVEAAKYWRDCHTMDGRYSLEDALSDVLGEGE